MPGTSSRPNPRASAARRLVVAVGVTLGTLVTAFVVPGAFLGSSGSTAAGRADAYKQSYVAQAKNTRAAAPGADTIYLADGTHIHPNGLVDDGHGHNHNDPATKNSVSRSAPTTDAETADPTTPQQARVAVDEASKQRNQVEPALSHVPVSAAQTASPTNRYNMFNACYGLQSTKTGRWLTDANVPTFAAASESAGTPLYFKPSGLGRYLLYSPDHRYLDGGAATATYADAGGPSNDWVVQMPKAGQFTFQIPGKGYLTDGASNATITATPTLLRLHQRSGCAEFPEVSTNVSGNPFAGVSKTQEVRGFVDAHTHGMAFKFLGG